MTYQTRQRSAIVGFLRSTPDSVYTIKEITQALQSDASLEKPPAESTVYRIVAALVADGIMKRIPCENGRRVVYSLTADESCMQHLHLQCRQCGRLYHMGNDESRTILHLIALNERFIIDSSAVLSGICIGCREKEEPHE